MVFSQVVQCTQFPYITASSETFYLGAERVGGVWQWVDGTKTVFQDDDLIDSTIGDCLVLDGSSASLTSTSCTTSAKYVCMSGRLCEW